MASLFGSVGRLWEDTVDPTVNEDESNGYEIGNWWLNTSTNKLFQCLDVTNGAALWQLKPSQVDDYFTPNLKFGGNNVGMSYAANGQVGYFQRNGNNIYISIYIKLTSKGTSTGNATIEGLPFTSDLNGTVKGLNMITQDISLSLLYNNMHGRINPNSSVISLIQTSFTLGNNIINTTNSHFSNNSILQVDGFYIIS